VNRRLVNVKIRLEVLVHTMRIAYVEVFQRVENKVDKIGLAHRSIVVFVHFAEKSAGQQLHVYGVIFKPNNFYFKFGSQLTRMLT